MMDSRVVVVGGGLAGLTAARRLAEQGLDVTLYERDPDVGGRVRSTRADSYIFDRGFQVLFTAYPAAQRELDMDALELREFSPGAVLCREDRRSVLADPLRDPKSVVESALNREVTTLDKLRTLTLRADLAQQSLADVFDGPDATIEHYLYDRGFSEDYVNNFVRPFYGGITLDRSLSTSKRVFEFTFKMLSVGATAVPAGGMGAISRQLRAHAVNAGARVVTETPVERIERGDAGVAVHVPNTVVDADAVVVAADPKASADLTDVDAIPTEARGCVTQWFGLPSGHPLADRDRIHLNVDGAVPNTVAPMSGVADEYAPAGRELIAATTVGQRDEPNDDLGTQTRETLAGWYPEASLGDFDLLRTDRIEFAQFAQPPGIHEDLPDTRAPTDNVYLAGDYTHHSSINGALESGAAAAQAVTEDLA